MGAGRGALEFTNVRAKDFNSAVDVLCKDRAVSNVASSDVGFGFVDGVAAGAMEGNAGEFRVSLFTFRVKF